MNDSLRMSRHFLMVAMSLILATGQFSVLASAQSTGVVLYSGGTGGTGRVNADGSFTNLQYYMNFSPWTQIVMTYNRMLLFYNNQSGAAATGYMDSAGNIVNLRSYTLSPGWMNITAVGNDKLFFYAYNYHTYARGGAVARIDTSGNFTTLWTSTNLSIWTNIVGTSSPPYLFFYGFGNSATAKVNPNGSLVTVDSRSDLAQDWGSVVATNTCQSRSNCTSFIFFHELALGTAAVGYLDAFGRFVNLRDLGSGFYPPGGGPWYSIGATNSSDGSLNGILLFYGPSSGAAATGYLDTDGWFHNLKSLNFVPNWNIVSSFSGISLYPQ